MSDSNSGLSEAGRSTSDYIKFVVPSLIGLLIFLTPIAYDDKHTIVMAIILDWFTVPLEPYNVEIILSIVTLVAIGSGFFLFRQPNWEQKRPLLFSVFQVTPIWFLFRAGGAVIGWLVYLQIGPEVIWAPDTGYMVFTVIGPAIVYTVLIAGLLMPFLTDFGLLEFIGRLLRKPFKLLFRLPGRAAVDATSSIVTASVVGLLITVKQYEQGHYTAREAAAVATNFSIVSLPFSLVIAKTAGIDHMFFTWYLTVLSACLVCAFILVRIPPLTRIEDRYFVEKRIEKVDDTKQSLIQDALYSALEQSAQAPTSKKMVAKGLSTALTTITNVTGPGMVVATGTAILAFHASLFEILAWPIFMLLDLFSLPEANKAAPGFIVGFFDQFTPAIIATKIESERVRFILAGFSLSQLIYMADYGIFVLRSSLPLNFLDLAKIFALRTLILFPIFLLVGHWLIP